MPGGVQAKGYRTFCTNSQRYATFWPFHVQLRLLWLLGWRLAALSVLFGSRKLWLEREKVMYCLCPQAGQGMQDRQHVASFLGVNGYCIPANPEPLVNRTPCNLGASRTKFQNSGQTVQDFFAFGSSSAAPVVNGLVPLVQRGNFRPWVFPGPDLGNLTTLPNAPFSNWSPS